MQETITKSQATNLALAGVSIQSDEEAAIAAQESVQEIMQAQLAQDHQATTQAHSKA